MGFGEGFGATESSARSNRSDSERMDSVRSERCFFQISDLGHGDRYWYFGILTQEAQQGLNFGHRGHSNGLVFEICSGALQRYTAGSSYADPELNADVTSKDTSR